MNTLMKNNARLLPEFPSIFDDFFRRDLFDWNSNNTSNGGTLPAINVKETKDSFELEVAAPGMHKKDFKVELDNNLLIISAEKAEEHENQGKEKGDYTRKEFSYQSFVRTFSFPERMVEGDKISAKYQDGILHLTVPKTEDTKVKPAKRIEVS